MVKNNSKESVKDVELKLVKYTQNLIKSQDAFDKSIKDYQVFLQETLTEQLQNIQFNEKYLEELQQKCEVKKKQVQIELDLYVQEYKLKAIKEYMEERGEVAVNKEEYSQLIEQNASLLNKYEQMIKDAVKEEQSKNSKSLEHLKRTLELQKNVEVAKVTAQLETQVEQIKFLYETINSLKADINAQRELTKDVAMSSNRQVYVPTQQQQFKS